MTVTINGTTGIANDGGYTGDGIIFADTTPANTLVTTTGGNVGIGTSSPTAKFQVGDGTATTEIRIDADGGSGVGGFVRGYRDTVNPAWYLGDLNPIAGGANTGLCAYAYGANPITFYTNGSERARIDSSGNLLVGTTSASCGGVTVTQHISASDFCLGLTATGGGASRQVVRFSYSTTAVGSITVGASSTSYNTSSDYRLKENVAPMTGALAKVAALKPCTYKWKSDGSDGEGFIAHELQEVVPDCVTGEKDAVDENGNPQYQGIDTSFLVATLTAAIQEQQAIITQLQADVAALKGA